MTELPIYVIYKKPSDYPHYFVIRKFILDKPTNEVMIACSLEEIRKKLPKGLIRIERSPTDDEAIIESWI